MTIPLNKDEAVSTNLFWIFDAPDPFEYNELLSKPDNPLIEYWFKKYTQFIGMVQKLAKKDGKKLDIAQEAVEGGFKANFEHWLPRLPELLSRDHAKRRLHSFYDDEDELQKALESLYRAARSAKQENGISSLYLGIGLLRWFETKESEKPCYAPLLLVPIEIVRKSAGQGYTMYRRDEDTTFNLTLLEMLRQNFQLEIPGIDPLPMDSKGVDVRLVFSRVRNAIIGMDKWECLETAVVGNFSFAQFAMWNDIHSNPEALEKSDIVRSLMKGYVDWKLPEAENTEGSEVYLPINVDATQLKAIQMAAAGNTFVLHGPPGTGKSQTITAMIANALAHGKTVLFVAEKMAALSVVDRRLTGLGIGDFCLELHSDKANKKHVLGQLERALNAARVKEKGTYAESAKETAAQRKKLDAYAAHLYAVQPCGLSLRELVDLYDSFDDNDPSVTFTTEEAKAVTTESLHAMPELLKSLTAAGAAIGSIHEHPLLGTGLKVYTS